MECSCEVKASRWFAGGEFGLCECGLSPNLVARNSFEYIAK